MADHQLHFVEKISWVQETLHTLKALRCPLKVAWDHVMHRQDFHRAPSNETKPETQLQHHVTLRLGAQE